MAVIRLGDADEQGKGHSTNGSLGNGTRGYNNPYKAEPRPVDQTATTTTVTTTVVVYNDRPIFYYKRGYYVAGATFEYWRSTDPNSSPPSGNSLIDISIVGRVTGETI